MTDACAGQVPVRFFDRNGLGPTTFHLKIETTPDLFMLHIVECALTPLDLTLHPHHGVLYGGGLSFQRGQALELSSRLEAWMRVATLPDPLMSGETVRAISRGNGLLPGSVDDEVLRLRAENAKLRAEFIQVTEHATELAARVRQLEAWTPPENKEFAPEARGRPGTLDLETTCYIDGWNEALDAVKATRP